MLAARRAVRPTFGALFPSIPSREREREPRPRRLLATLPASAAASAMATLPASATAASAAAVATSPASAAALIGTTGVTVLQVGPVLSCQVLWAAPYPTIQEVIAKKTTGGLPPLGYFSMFANGYLWCGYGISAGMDPTIICPNITGMLAGAYYSYNFYKHNSGQHDLTPYYAGTAASVVSTTGLLLFAPELAQTSLGYLGCAVVVAMFSGPLMVIKEVIDTKSTKNLPFPMAIATVVNCSLWLGFGLLVIDDPFVWFPNVLGLGSGIAQLALFAKYGFHTEADKKDEAE